MIKYEMRSARNGAVLKIIDDANDETLLTYQEGSEEEQEVERFAEFLQSLDENYGPATSRYSPKRIHIIVKPGDKYEIN